MSRTRSSRTETRSSWRARLSEWASRSAGLFLIGLIVACAIEVAVDWNSTLFEINVLRTEVREKGEHYADLLRKAGEAPLLAYDWDELERITSGLFDDEDVAYVRYTDMLGNTLYDRLRPDYGGKWSKAHGGASFREHYRRVMARDAGGIMNDPVALRRKMAESRHKDFIQSFTDAEEGLIARLSSGTAAENATPPRVLYQDRLADAERDLTYAVGAVTSEEGDAYGAVLVAFRMDAINAEIVKKLLKGLAITVFFVGLILVQNLVSRRGKLRLLDYEVAQAAARRAIEASLSPIPELVWGTVTCKISRPGTVVDLDLDDRGALVVMVAHTGGAPVEASFAALEWLRIYRGYEVGDPGERAQLALAAWAKLPNQRALELSCVRVTKDGAEGVSAQPLRQFAAPFIADRMELGGAVTVTKTV